MRGVRRLIRRIGKTDQALRLGGSPAVRTSLNSSGRSLRRNDLTDKVITSLRMTALRMVENQLYDS